MRTIDIRAKCLNEKEEAHAYLSRQQSGCAVRCSDKPGKGNENPRAAAGAGRRLRRKNSCGNQRSGGSQSKTGAAAFVENEKEEVCETVSVSHTFFDYRTSRLRSSFLYLFTVRRLIGNPDAFSFSVRIRSLAFGCSFFRRASYPISCSAVKPGPGIGRAKHASTAIRPRGVRIHLSRIVRDTVEGCKSSCSASSFCKNGAG